MGDSVGSRNGKTNLVPQDAKPQRLVVVVDDHRPEELGEVVGRDDRDAEVVFIHNDNGLLLRLCLGRGDLLSLDGEGDVRIPSFGVVVVRNDHLDGLAFLLALRLGRTRKRRVDRDGFVRFARVENGLALPRLGFGYDYGWGR